MSSSGTTHVTVGPLQIRGTLTAAYGDVFTPAALAAIEALVPFDRAPGRAHAGSLDASRRPGGGPRADRLPRSGRR